MIGWQAELTIANTKGSVSFSFEP